MGGVTIGKNSVIGAGSVITKNIPENVIVAGVPCKVIREITEKDKTGFYLDVDCHYLQSIRSHLSNSHTSNQKKNRTSRILWVK